MRQARPFRFEVANIDLLVAGPFSSRRGPTTISKGGSRKANLGRMHADRAIHLDPDMHAHLNKHRGGDRRQREHRRTLT
jgi:hypothetical protein